MFLSLPLHNCKFPHPTLPHLCLQAKASPFFLYLAYTTPHAGAVGSLDENDVPVPNVSKGPYANETWPKVERDFATAVFELDAAVGKVLATLKAEQLEGDTLVIFASDNGAHNEGGHDYLFFNR